MVTEFMSLGVRRTGEYLLGLPTKKLHVTLLLGCTGLEELLGIDPAFEQFEAPLFSQLAKGLERSVQTKAVNKQLDENISSFLLHLSPYFLLKPAQKCLEWLIHR
jgi:U3 small nucleolar RNA-associated protein 10